MLTLSSFRVFTPSYKPKAEPKEKRPQKTWAADEIEAAKALALDGLSRAAIATALNGRFGNGRTRNAVIGLLQRELDRTAPARREKASRSDTLVGLPETPRMASARPEKQVRGWPIPRGPLSVWFGEAKRDQCRFPLWADNAPLADKFVCGEPVEPGKPYCPACCANSYRGTARVA
jgi:hypothetical protein